MKVFEPSCNTYPMSTGMAIGIFFIGKIWQDLLQIYKIWFMHGFAREQTDHLIINTAGVTN